MATPFAAAQAARMLASAKTDRMTDRIVGYWHDILLTCLDLESKGRDDATGAGLIQSTPAEAATAKRYSVPVPVPGDTAPIPVSLLKLLVTQLEDLQHTINEIHGFIPAPQPIG